MQASGSNDLSIVPFWDGETSDGLLNRYGGQPGAQFNLSLNATSDARSGGGAFLLTTPGIAPGQIGFIQTTLAPTAGTPAATHRRDISAFETAEFYLRNDTGTAFDLRFEVKDYRDSNAHRASWTQTIQAGNQWQHFAAPLDLSTPGWSVVGSPDLSQASRFSYVVTPTGGQTVQGSVIIDDAAFIEPGGPVDVQTAPIRTVAERLAFRQWNGLWGSRNRDTGMIPLHNTSGFGGAMNTSSAVLKMLPGAVQRGWVTQSEADQHVTNLVGSLNQMLDQSMYLPYRYTDWTTLQPTGGGGNEESSIDAAFMALALHQYKNAPGVSPAVADAVDQVQNRFNFEPFNDQEGGTRGWKFAYVEGQGLTDGTYDSYSGEPWVISLAAHLSDDHHVPIETQWNSAVFRTQDHLVDPTNRHVVSSFEQFRPAFVQWLLPMFVDTSDRGEDTYPVPSLRTNPNVNAEKYQRDVADFFASIGRAELLQPDAGANGFGDYEQYSAYQDFGNPDLFMPWAVTEVLLGDEAAADAALRTLLEADLEGPLGLSDIAYWTTGEPEPDSTRAFVDFWNTSLSTMALMEYLYGEAALFAALPEVSAALDRVFYLAGDYNANGLVEQGDLDNVLQNWGRDVAATGLPNGWNNDKPYGLVDQAELDRVLQNWGQQSSAIFDERVLPEPAGVVAVAGAMWFGCRTRRRPASH